MIKLVANKDSYGFLGKFWSKGEHYEVNADVVYPKEHFDVVGEIPKAKKPMSAPKPHKSEVKK